MSTAASLRKAQVAIGFLLAALGAGCLRTARDSETLFRLALMDCGCGDPWRAMKPIEPSGASDAWLRERTEDRVMIVECNVVPTRAAGMERMEEARAEVLEIMDGFICGYRDGFEGRGGPQSVEEKSSLWKRGYREGLRFGVLDRGVARQSGG